ncbi:ubiquinol-cytochrome c reductase iron-sulfur subunit [Nocardia seriolae]|uniref:Cytochrome bc1 complex Rieske iron-sulfur subunit n=1 Tax=Nocardia seriolae TaxID=37332 RepID=A0A0B8N5Y9_9NOCA|nr:Rieske (2Fe-2S) protein [Nocardia seriolae]APA96908.1 Thiosulfate dehydrogenase (quinone) [Nocardia seriolae]MTJ65278.1 Rieske 2Fe-2S domain-containing protein [Nocardia seriolae]MTJ70670.1 Rieske 2Fe-2S domain-containing protein [Nocardia seriolae]MTJ86805.1 Rieske 2Fe-2S domain-containing protein [Nocardia seriolae]MTK30799.1 Rieske 2Fe-2S domain-containing protein [Nocardia seriolae]
MTETNPGPGGFALDRRTALAATAIAVTAMTVAACNDGTSEPAAAASNTTQAKAPAKQQDDDELAYTKDVPVGGGIIKGDTVITQPAAGTYQGFSSTCTHLGCKVNEVTDGLIKCPCHGSSYHLDGSVAGGPAPRALDAKAIKVEGDKIVSA